MAINSAILNRFILLLLSIIVANTSLNAQISAVLLADQTVMEDTRMAIQQKDQEALAQVNLLQSEADLALKAKPTSVMDKEVIPPSGDKHDYMSQGPYWWPDPEKPDGLPYIRRDGLTNPEREKFTDRRNLYDLVRKVDVLAKTYYFNQEEAYAEKAAELIRVWFLDEASRMNPNLKYGQGIPGRSEGRGIGLIETRRLGWLLDAIYLLRASAHWTETHEAGMQDWMKRYFHWLRHSQHGKDEAVYPNNHGTWYAVQYAAIAIYTEQPELAEDWIEKAKVMRLDAHIDATGEQPLETERTRGWDYSVMNLWGLFQLAMIGERFDIDLWSYRNVHGATLQDALEYLIPFALGEKELPFEQIRVIEAEKLIPHLLVAAKVYGKPSYLKVVRRIRKKLAKEPDTWSLFY